MYKSCCERLLSRHFFRSVETRPSSWCALQKMEEADKGIQGLRVARIPCDIASFHLIFRRDGEPRDRRVLAPQYSLWMTLTHLAPDLSRDSHSRAVYSKGVVASLIPLPSPFFSTLRCARCDTGIALHTSSPSRLS